jgi:hypothetical protein
METEERAPAIRTERNVRDSDATLLLSHGAPTGGTALTLEVAARLGRPHLHLDLDATSPSGATRLLRDWLGGVRPRTLNVAGPRASKDPEIFAASRFILESALRSQDPAKQSRDDQ